MAGNKKYDIDGVAESLQLGKNGPHLLADNDAIELRGLTGNLAVGKAAPGVSDNDIVVLSQLNALGTSLRPPTAPTNFLVVDHQVSGVTSLGGLSAGSRVSLVTVEVAVAFDGDFEILIGTASIANFYMGPADIDLRSVGTYVVSGFSSTDDTSLALTVTGTATVGSAKVKLVYA